MVSEFVGTVFEPWGGYQNCTAPADCIVPGAELLSSTCYPIEVNQTLGFYCMCTWVRAGPLCDQQMVLNAYISLAYIIVRLLITIYFLLYGLRNIVTLTKVGECFVAANFMQYTLFLAFVSSLIHGVTDFISQYKFTFQRHVFTHAILIPADFGIHALNTSLLIAVWMNLVGASRTVQVSKKTMRVEIVAAIAIVDTILCILVVFYSLEFRYGAALTALTTIVGYHGIVLAVLVAWLKRLGEKTEDNSSTGARTKAFFKRSLTMALRLLALGVLMAVGCSLFYYYYEGGRIDPRSPGAMIGSVFALESVYYGMLIQSGLIMKFTSFSLRRDTGKVASSTRRFTK